MLDFLIEYGYYGLFLVAFLAATVLPFSSEFAFGGCLAAGLDPVWCVVWATAGNFLGGMTSYYLGYLGKIEWVEKYFKVKRENIEKTQHWLNNKGAYMAFFSFIPFIGDMIPLTLGFMRASITKTSISLFLGKIVRFTVMAYLWKAALPAVM
ncbi:MAG: YqaA family protein [Porphyromonadaceae bacterium]|nr:YqaA family protein [Porphyromonadaceae bacterium]